MVPGADTDMTRHAGLFIHFLLSLFRHIHMPNFSSFFLSFSIANKKVSYGWHGIISRQKKRPVNFQQFRPVNNSMIMLLLHVIEKHGERRGRLVWQQFKDISGEQKPKSSGEDCQSSCPRLALFGGRGSDWWGPWQWPCYSPTIFQINQEIRRG